MNRILGIFLISLFSVSASFGQNNIDTIVGDENKDSSKVKTGFFNDIINYLNKAKEDKSFEKFDISFVGGPSYSKDFSVGIGAVASGLYRIDKSDSTLPPSTVSIYTALSATGFFALGSENHTIFPHDKYRLNTEVRFVYNPIQYYGIGYEAGANDDHGSMRLYEITVKVNFLRQVLPNLFIGPSVDILNVTGHKFTDPNFIPPGPQSNWANGFGGQISYDTRDFIPNPYRGVFLHFAQTFYFKSLGSTRKFNRTEFGANYYQKVWKNAHLAFDFNGELNNGTDIPWGMLSKLGGARQMRGYYRGRYRDKDQLNFQVELRQKVYRRNGFVIWAGAGQIFKKFTAWEWDRVLPTYGLGYRWEFKNRVNIRLDFGMGKGQSGFYFNIEEAF